jgi:small nuclear ribonucleoprotein (snRNP)-like protein
MAVPKPNLAESSPAPDPKPLAQMEFSGQRRLIRPSLPTRATAGRQTALYGHGPALTSRGMQPAGGQEESSHAEVFYFQKQIQAQTRMIVVLENGEHLEGVIEWYDRYAIKLRHLSGPAQDGPHAGSRTRMLVYKDCIRYIYKAGDSAPQTMS